MSMPDYPYLNFHELNLDWLIKKVQEAYSPDNPPESFVLSVNGETGDVVLYKNAEVRFPTVSDVDDWSIKRYVSGNTSVGVMLRKNYPMQRIAGSNRYDIYDSNNPPPYPVTSVNGQTGAVTVNVPVQSVNGKTGAVTGLYDSDNPPPYPVASVNGQTGAVTIAIPVQSVNGQTGAVTIPVAFKNNTDAYLMPTVDLASSDEWGFDRNIQSGTTGISFEVENGHVSGYINFYDTEDQVIDKLKILTPADIPSTTGVISVNGMSGVVTGLYDASNPPPYPVTSVNGSTGDVVISIPVASVNGATGAVVLTGDTIATSATDNTPLATTIENAYEESLEDIAIVVKGNKTLNSSGASIGQYVVVRNSTISGVADGLYTAIKVIPYNTAIDSTYLSTAIIGGVANKLGSLIDYKVTGATSATDNAVALFDGTTGKQIKNSGKTIADATTSTAIGNNANICTNRTIRNSYYNGLDKTAAGFALDARQGKTLNDKITGLVEKHTITGSTNTSGDIIINDYKLSDGYVLIAVFPDRSAGYSSWHGSIVSSYISGSSKYWSVKLVNDSDQNLASTAVVLDCYFIKIS